MAVIEPTVKKIRKPPTKRTYQVDGVRLPSVTTVLSVIRKPELEEWMARVGLEEAERVRDESAARGTRIHRACEIIANGGKAKPEPDIVEPVVAFRRWFREHVGEVKYAEKRLVSFRHQYAGTADLIAYLDNDDLPSLIDYKTGKYPHKEWALQTAAYAEAAIETAIPIQRRVVVQIPASGTEVTVHRYTDDKNDLEAFLAALRLWKWLDMMERSKAA